MKHERHPRFWKAWPELADFVAWMHSERVRTYPGMVDKGKLDAGTAAHAIQTMADIAAIWRAAVDRVLPEPDLLFSPSAMIADLAATLARVDDQFARHPVEHWEHRRDALIALLWWHRKFTDGPLHIVRANQVARARMAAEQAERKAA